MFKFNPDRYRYYIHQSKDHGSTQITAVSTYAGKTVKGYAKCDPQDNYNEELGMKLAAARCNLRVANLRKKRAQRKFDEAQARLEAAQKFATDMGYYWAEATSAVKSAQADVEDILSTLSNVG